MTPLDNIVRTTARAHERDRYLAALLAPRLVRDDLIALAAFAGEVGRVPLSVRDPMMARIRLQWWRERIETRTSGGHPVAAAIIDVMARHRLAAEQLDAIIDGHEDRLADRPFGSDADLLANVDAIDRNLFAIAAQICSGGPPDDITADVGRAYGLARIGLELPASLAHGQMMLPSPALAASESPTAASLRPAIAGLAATARRYRDACSPAIGALSRAARSPFLPVALVEPYLRALERSSFENRRPDLNPLVPVWRLLRGHWTGAVR